MLSHPTDLQVQRIHPLNGHACRRKGEYVLYWMQQAQRVHYNHALNYAVEKANASGLPVLVLFGLTEDYPEANWRHYAFMLEGLAEVDRLLAEMGIAFQVCLGCPPELALEAARRASFVVCDRGYLRHQRLWRARLAERATCAVVEIESDAIVPVDVVSTKAEYAARTIRPKIHRHLPAYLTPLPLPHPRHSRPAIANRPDFASLAHRLSVNRAIAAVTPLFPGGRHQALQRLKTFMQEGLVDYALRRSKLTSGGASQLSPYLHFGQIASLEIALAVREAQAPEEARTAFLEELAVRRELAFNYVWRNPQYDRYSGLPAWSRRTLAAHRGNRRKAVYTYRTLEAARSHDPYWNAAMREMRETGYLPNHMRMYWGKKILQWQTTPWQAFQTALRLNNTYFLDGRDPNSYAGVGWIFGLHDRPWQERPIFGQVRYMARSGLERKFDMRAYLNRVADRIAQVRSDSRQLMGR